MRHNWQHRQSYRGSERICLNCGAEQVYDLVSYDRMSGGTWRWRPLVGHCKVAKPDPVDETYRGFIRQADGNYKRLDSTYAIDVILTDGEWTVHHLSGGRIIERSFKAHQAAIDAVLTLEN